MSKIDTETLDVLIGFFKSLNSVNPVPVAPQPQYQPPKDSDTFGSLITGANKNWGILMAIAASIAWLIGGINDGKTRDSLQDSRIEANTTAIEKLVTAAQSTNSIVIQQQTAQSQINSEILSNIKLIQKDIESIQKAKN